MSGEQQRSVSSTSCLADAEVAFRFHHKGVAVPELDPAIRVYEDLFGYRLRSGPYEDPIQRVAVCFLEMGGSSETTLELIAPLSGDSPIKGALAKGGGAYHVCFETLDLDQGLKRLTDKGCMIVSKPVPAVAFGGRRIAWIFTPTRQLVELIEVKGEPLSGRTGATLSNIEPDRSSNADGSDTDAG